jgi:hypothetical protein
LGYTRLIVASSSSNFEIVNALDTTSTSAWIESTSA